jgi:hypothetical protein
LTVGDSDFARCRIDEHLGATRSRKVVANGDMSRLKSHVEIGASGLIQLKSWDESRSLNKIGAARRTLKLRKSDGIAREGAGEAVKHVRSKSVGMRPSFKKFI